MRTRKRDIIFDLGPYFSPVDGDLDAAQDAWDREVPEEIKLRLADMFAGKAGIVPIRHIPLSNT